MRDIFLKTGEPLNTHLWNGFIDLIVSNSYNACSSFQSALKENDNLKIVWDRTQQAGAFEDTEWVKLDRSRAQGPTVLGD